MENKKAIFVPSSESVFSSFNEHKKIGNLNSIPPQIELHQKLLDDCVRNDAQAQKELYNLYSIAIFNTCKRMVANRDDAQDLLQDSFIDAFRGIRNFNGKSTFGAWLKRIAINKCINHLKRQKVIQFERLSDDYEGELTNESDSDFEINIQMINLAIMKLPHGCRMVFVMKAMEGFDHKEIAHEMQISIGTSKSQFNRAKQLLQEYLKENAQ